MTVRDVINSSLPTTGTGAISAATMRTLLSMIIPFDSIAQLQAATLDPGMSFVVTLGIGDKEGFCFWKPATTQGPMFNNVQSADGKYWERVTGQLPVLNVGDYGVHGDGVTWNQVIDGTSGPWWDWASSISRQVRSGSYPVTIDSGGTTVVHWPNHDMRRNDCFCFIPGGMPAPSGITLLQPYYVLDYTQGTPGQHFTKDTFSFSADNAWQVGGVLPSPPNVPVSTSGGASGIYGPVTFSGSDVQWSGHNITANTPVCFVSDQALPQNLISPTQPCKLTLFYASATGLVPGTSFKISTTPGGSVITFSDGGQGNHTGFSNPLFVTPLNREWVKTVIPPGYYRFPHEIAYVPGSGSQRKMLIEAYGAVFDQLSCGNTDAAAFGQWALINSVQHGSTVLQLKDPTRYNLFYVGQWIRVAGIDTQNFYVANPVDPSVVNASNPPNFGVCQYVKIIAINSSGAVTISEPTYCSFSAKWPMIFPGTNDGGNQYAPIGPAGIYALGAGWDQEQIFRGFRALEPWGPSIATGRFVKFEDCALDGQGLQPSTSKRVIFERCRVCGDNTGIEVDKNIEYLEYKHCEGTNISLNLASAATNVLSVQGCKFAGMYGTVKRNVFKESKIQNMVFGPTFGVTESCLLLGNEINKVDIVTRFDDANGPTAIYNMIERFTWDNGTFRIPLTSMANINQWAIPGHKMFVTDMAGVHANMGAPFMVGNIFTDGSNNFCFETTLTSKPVGNSTKSTVTFSGNFVLWSGHSLSVDTPVHFTTTGTFPVDQSTTFYVLSAGMTTGQFQVATSKGGSPVNLSAATGTVTAVSNALKFRPHPMPRLTAFGNTGGRMIADLNGSIEDPLFSRGRREFFGWQESIAGYVDAMILWGNVDTFLINVLRPAIYTGSSSLRFSITSNAFDSNLIQNNFTATIDLTQAGLRTITRTGPSGGVGADSFSGFANWLSDVVSFSMTGATGGGQGGPLSQTPIVDVFLKTDQGITKFNCWQWLGTTDDHSKIIADGSSYGYAS
jgi:hypothetical protein